MSAHVCMYMYCNICVHVHVIVGPRMIEGSEHRNEELWPAIVAFTNRVSYIFDITHKCSYVFVMKLDCMYIVYRCV